jgi:glucan phosphoethanolaminetransferase (alkaline phosphatase superfamily)
MTLSFEFFFYLLEKILVSMHFWLPVIGLIHFAAILSLKKKIWSVLSILLILVFWIVAGHPLIESILNAGVDTFLELRTPDIGEVIFWLYTNLGSTFPSKNYLILWFLISFGYATFWSILYFSSLKERFYRAFIRFEILTIASLVLLLPLGAVLEKRGEALAAIEQFDITKEKFDTNNDNIMVSKSKESLPVFLYIGESTSSMNMEIYGYPRATNPMLNSLSLKDKNFIKVPNVWSSHTHTIPSLLDAFSVKKEESNKDIVPTILNRSAHPLITLLKKADIDTHIVANHIHDDFLSLIFKDSATLRLPAISKDSLDPDKELRFDHEVLEEALIELSAQVKFDTGLYIFHSYAGHGSYKKFIPQNFHLNVDKLLSDISESAVMGNIPFKDIDHIESYDSAIKYIDSNIATAISFVKTINRPMVFVYFPDHGESVYTRRGHDSSKFSLEMAQIPLIVYFNDLAIKQNTLRFNKIKKRLESNEFATLSQIPSFLSEIMGVKIFDISKNKKLADCTVGSNTCQDKYLLVRQIAENKSVVRTKVDQILNNDIIDNTDSATDHYNLIRQLGIKDKKRICYHRSNSVAKAIRGLSLTNCLELDVVVNNKDIYVYHPPEENYGLSLQTILNLAEAKETTLWLDAKNIHSNKNCQILKEQISPVAETGTKIFIEFPSLIFGSINDPEECMNSLQDLGFSVAYYIPTIASECAVHISKGENISESKSCIRLQEIILWAAEKGTFTDISFDYSAYEAIVRMNRSRELKWNIWGIEPKEILELNLDEFHLIIPKNKDPNNI